MNHPFIFLLILVLIGSCDPCSECSEPLVVEPTVEMIFINQDSIVAIDDSLSVIAFNDSSLLANIDSLTLLNDSLTIILDSISNGGILETEKLSLESLILLRQADSALFATLNKDADSISTILIATKSTINEGFLLIEQIEIVESNGLITYSDSANSWDLPLLFDGNQTSYDLTISESVFSISLSYETFTEVSEEREITIRASDISILNTIGFDSLINCETNCVDGNASFTFYF